MFSYASKRLTRGRGLSLALFLSVILAATLFSGILQGSDAVSGSLISNTLKETRYDVIATDVDKKNVTETNIYGIDAYFEGLKGVETTDHFLRQEITLNSTTVNGTITTTIVAIPPTSGLLKNVDAPNGFEDGKVYIDVGSVNATKFWAGETISLGLLTYSPYKGISDFRRQYYPAVVGSNITIDDEAWSIFVANEAGLSYYNLWVTNALSGGDGIGGRPTYNLVLVTENTYKAILDSLYDKPVKLDRRAPTIIHSVAAIRLDRSSLINPWDIPGTQSQVQRLAEQINGMGGVYYYTTTNYLGMVLNAVAARSQGSKLNTIIITTPVFFTAWYLGMTVSDVAFGMRRKEIGLLLTRGLSHRQVFTALLSEAALLGVAAGLLGVAAGALILPFVISGADFASLFRYVSPVTFGATLAFSLLLSTLAAISPARKATQIEIVDALREYRAEEESLGGWQVPLMAFLLGLYKVAFLLLGIDIESFRPTSGDFITSVAYSTWYGLNYLLDFIWAILLFWGFTKLFLMYVPQFQGLLGRVSAALAGDASIFTSLSSRRNLKRVAAYTFMVSLIMSYSVVVVGNSAMTSDFLSRFYAASIGADASMPVYGRSVARDLVEKVRALDGVDSAAIEVAFNAESSAGVIPIRAVEVAQWNKTANIDELAIDPSAYAQLASPDAIVKDQYGVLQGGNALLDRGASKYFGISDDGTGFINVRVEKRVYTLKIVGLFGPDLGENWVVQPQTPMIIIPLGFVEKFQNEWISGVRVVARFKQGADPQAFIGKVNALGLNIQKVEVTSIFLAKVLSSPLVAGSQQTSMLGLIFAALVASVGMTIIVYTLLRSRSKELNLMSIRGYNARQLSTSLITENVGLATFASAIGIAIGLLSLTGQVQLYNKYVQSFTSWRFVFPLFSQLQLALLYIIIVVATIAPIILVVRRITEEPNLKGES